MTGTPCADYSQSKRPGGRRDQPVATMPSLKGHLIGEVIRRIMGRTLGQFFAQDIAEPLNADFHIGTPEHVFDRIATLSPPGAEGLPADLDEDSVAARTFRSPAPVAEAAMTKAGALRRSRRPTGTATHGVSYAPKLRCEWRQSVRCRAAVT